MKPTRALQITWLMMCIAITGGCQKQSKNGEAFVVLRSDAVIYMADMQVLCFKADFKKHFLEWKKDWETAYRTQVTEIEKTNPELQSELKEIDAIIAARWTETNSIEREAITFLIRSAKSERDDVAAQLAKAKSAYDEYKQISSPFAPANLIEKETSIRKRRRAIALETIEKVNQQIADAHLPIPKLETDLGENVFAGDWRETNQRTGLVIPYQRTGLVIHFEDGDAVWFYQIPEQLKGSDVELFVKTGYLEYKRLTGELEVTTRLIDGGEAAAKQALMERYGLDADESSLEAAVQRLNARLNDLSGRLARLNTRNAKDSKEVNAEVQERLRKLTKGIEELRERREKTISDATRQASLKVKHEFRSKFFDLLKQNAAGSIQTGSKGDFSIPGSIAYLYAERHRDNEETLVWLVRVDSKATRIRLSNSNTAVAGGQYDEFWMLEYNLD